MVYYIISVYKWGRISSSPSTTREPNKGVSKNKGGPPKWMVKIMENPIFFMDDFGVKPTIFGNIHIQLRSNGAPGFFKYRSTPVPSHVVFSGEVCAWRMG